jgi:hypothetical protein
MPGAIFSRERNKALQGVNNPDIKFGTRIYQQPNVRTTGQRSAATELSAATLTRRAILKEGRT